MTPNQVQYSQFSFLEKSQIEGKKDLARQNYWDNTGAHTMPNMSLVEASDSVSAKLLSAYKVYTFRNNGAVTVNLQFTTYQCKVALDSASHSPLSLWSQCMTRRDANLGVTTNTFETSSLFNIREPCGGPKSAYDRDWETLSKATLH